MIGFEGDRVVWGLCNGVPVCVATDKIRPCTPEKTLAYLYLNDQSMQNYTPARTDQQQKYVSVVQDDVDISAQEIDLLGRDQDLKATGEKRNRDYLADDELDEQLTREIDLIGVKSADRASSSVPELPAPPKLEISKSSKVPTAPEGGSSSSSQLPAGSNLADHFQKTGVTGPGVKVMKQLVDKELSCAKTKVVPRTPRKGRSRSPY